MTAREPFEQQRTGLVEYISAFAAKSPGVKQAFLSVPRELFVPEGMRQYAYDDNALPVWKGQTISQPSTIAFMLELLEVKNGMKVLEVGSGTGYVLALLSKMVGSDGKVFGVEIDSGLAEKSVESLRAAGVSNALVKQGDGSAGWEENAPFDRALVSCACPFVPKEIFSELAEGGRVVAPVGDQASQLLEVLIKKDGKPIKKTFEGGLFAFVPLRGKAGFT